MSFVPEYSSFCIQMIKSNGSAVGVLAYIVFTLDSSSDMHAPLATDYTICDTKSSLTKFVFSLHDARMKFQT